jgi:hypothetical protein
MDFPGYKKNTYPKTAALVKQQRKNDDDGDG